MEVGYVSRAHGLRGEVCVTLHWRGSVALESAQRVTLEVAGARTVRSILSARAATKGTLVIFEGAEDRSAAEALKGSTVLVARDQLPPLEEGEYYLADLVGANVSDREGPIGVVVRVGMHPSVDTVVVRTSNGQELEQALAEPWIETVDVAQKRIVLTTRAGMI